MKSKLNDKKQDEEEIIEDIPGAVYNLAAALSCLEELEGGLRPNDLRDVKDKIFDALMKMCDKL